MERKALVNHIKEQKRSGKTNWSKVQQTKNSPVIDAENPELAFKAGTNFRKPGKKSS